MEERSPYTRKAIGSSPISLMKIVDRLNYPACISLPTVPSGVNYTLLSNVP